jgi:hypothetical protein
MMNNELTKNKRLFTILNVGVILGLIVLEYLGLFDSGEWFGFLLLSAGVLVLATYKPVVVFALLVGVIPIEIINIAPQQLGIDLRPYQFLTVVLVVAVIIRHIIGFSKQKMFKWSIFDTLVAIFIGMGFVNLLFIEATIVSLKQSIVVMSFGILYFVVRYFVRSKDDVLALFPILISSAVVVSLYAILQNVMFVVGVDLAEVMPGRPNATFAEPDWLGVYTVFSLAVGLAYLYYSSYHKHLWKFFDGALFGATVILLTALIITVARSAWLGAVGAIIAYLLIVFFQKKYKLFAMHAFWIVSAGLLSLVVVWAFHLTNFELFNRVQSTHSGMQEITIACKESLTQSGVPMEIDDVAELEKYDCSHINLEDIADLEAQGFVIAKIYRTDPNVKARSNVYEQTITLITTKPLVGYGWGSSGALLGNDENGTPLNASNVFLETVLSIGVIGGIVLVLMFLLAVIFAIKSLLNTTGSKQKSVAIFIIIGTVAIIVPNLFNAGLFLGFVWLFFGMFDIIKDNN